MEFIENILRINFFIWITFNRGTMIIFILIYLVGVILCYGYVFAYYQREYKILADEDYYHDMRFSMIISISSFLGIFAIGILQRPGKFHHGLKFK